MCSAQGAIISSDAENRSLESKFFDAFERGDGVAIAECYAPEMRVWNNIYQKAVSGAEHIAGLEAQFFPLYKNRKFIEVRIDRIADGFVRQHVVTGLLDGQPVRIPMCIICRVSDGRLVRIDEYLNFAPPVAPSG